MSKCLLHKDKLQAFKDWLDSKGINHRESKDTYQVHQVYQQGQWMGVFRRNNMIEHLTVDVRLEELVRAFINTPKFRYTQEDLEYYIQTFEDCVPMGEGLDLTEDESINILEMLKHLKELTK